VRSNGYEKKYPEYAFSRRNSKISNRYAYDQIRNTRNIGYSQNKTNYSRASIQQRTEAPKNYSQNRAESPRISTQQRTEASKSYSQNRAESPKATSSQRNESNRGNAQSRNSYSAENKNSSRRINNRS
jgi:hypothetical protein